MTEKEENIVIEDAIDQIERFSKLGTGLSVTIKKDGNDLIVSGPDTYEYLKRLDPDTWDPANAIDEC